MHEEEKSVLFLAHRPRESVLMEDYYKNIKKSMTFVRTNLLEKFELKCNNVITKLITTYKSRKNALSTKKEEIYFLLSKQDIRASPI